MPTFVRRVLPSVAALLLLAPVHGAAQTPENVPGAGVWGVHFTLFDDDGSRIFGVSRMMSDRIKLGLELDLSYVSIEDEVEGPFGDDVTLEQYAVRPTFTWYGLRNEVVSPFLRGAVRYGWSSAKGTSSGIREIASQVVGGTAAVGAEWYPLRWLGVSGFTGFQVTRTEEEIISDTDRLVRDRTTWSYATFRSGLNLTFYFR